MMKQQTKFKDTETRLRRGFGGQVEKIPEDWEVKKIGLLGKIITGKTPLTKYADNFGGNYHFITPKDMHGQKYIRDTERYLTEKGKESVKNCLLPENTVCVSCIGSDMGKVIMICKPSVTNQQLNSLICSNIDANFAYYS